MIIVTGGAGFIGSNIIKTLNDAGESDIFVIDDLSNGHQVCNLADLDISDYLDRLDFIDRIRHGQKFGLVDAIFHQGANSATTDWDGLTMMQNNYEYSKSLLHWCRKREVPFFYASSASVYGGGGIFKEERQYERPINMYAYSKFQFDQYARRLQPQMKSQVVGLRYFNVYGLREQHKGAMASTVFHFNEQLLAGGTAKLFEGSNGYSKGEQRRDFISVDDVVKVNVWFMENPQQSGIFNLGTGCAQSFNDVANAVIKWHGKGTIEYIPFPSHLQGVYQSFTEADLTALRQAGYSDSFLTLDAGVGQYLDAFNGTARVE